MLLLCNINYDIKNYLINNMYILRSSDSDDDCKSAKVNTINKNKKKKERTNQAN